MLSLTLCCKFNDFPIKYKTTTVSCLSKLNKKDRFIKLDNIVLHNAMALKNTFIFCENSGIYSFRISSNLFPVMTHSEYGYTLQQLPSYKKISKIFQECGEIADKAGIRLSTHPDQFVVLNSPNPEIVKKSILELEMHYLLTKWMNMDVMNIHGGGGYGNKELGFVLYVSYE